MINHIRGTLTSKNPLALDAVIEAHGVGYALRVPRAAFDRLPAPGGEAILFTHMHFSANTAAAAFNLYGFRTEVERTVFRMLLGVDRVGPSQALAVMSGCDTAALVSAVRDGNVGLLKSFKGVGEKVAARIIHELSKAFKKMAADLPAASPAMPGPATDAVAILVSLGLTQADATRRVESAVGELGAETAANDLVRHCLAG